MPAPFPAPETLHPISLPDGGTHPGTVFLSAAIDHPRFEVGVYSYASDRDPPAEGGWAARLAPHLYDFSPERLRVGKFCQIAHGVRFITASANHRYDGISSYPFAIFGGGVAGRPSMPGPGADTEIGHDVWFGEAAMVMPGARIGSGVIVGAGAVVAGNVPDYAVVAGNPARVLRFRFPPETIEALLELAWWTWPIEQILAHEAEICGADVEALRAAAARLPAQRQSG
ncbi:MAG: CatB-related O-acetyltransferase [Pseudomonadota bacterium]